MPGIATWRMAPDSMNHIKLFDAVAVDAQWALLIERVMVASCIAW